MLIRRFRAEDAEETSRMIAASLRTTNGPDYPAEEIEELAEFYSPAGVLRRAGESHMYVACGGDGVIIGCGAVAGHNGSEAESDILTLFVQPGCQGRGVGREILKTLEADEIFLRADRVEVSSSITAHGFYKKLGYTYMHGSGEPDEHGSVFMEKRRMPHRP